MSADMQLIKDISKETGYNFNFCKLALEYSKQDKNLAIKNINLWTDINKKTKSTIAPKDTEYAKVITYYDPHVKAAAILKISSINQDLIESGELYEFLESAVYEVACYGDIYTLDEEKKKIESLYNGELTLTQRRIEKQNDQSLLTTYTHRNKIGSIVEISVDKDEDKCLLNSHKIRQFAFDCALHIAAFNPFAIEEKKLPDNISSKIIKNLEKELMEHNKPLNLWETIISGKMDKITKQAAMLNQIFIKSENKTVKDVKLDLEHMLGVKFSITNFARLGI